MSDAWLSKCRSLWAVGAASPHPHQPSAQASYHKERRAEAQQGRLVQQGLSRDLLQMVVAWGTDQVGQGGEAVILAKASTDVDIQAFEIAFFNETR